ncbi:hypothetical protein [Oricola sp.]|uniref:hypothetical protein n=1 Tax=Oricola sp. TaxID=1979950 RepID=UPI003BABEA00
MARNTSPAKGTPWQVVVEESERLIPALGNYPSLERVTVGTFTYPEPGCRDARLSVSITDKRFFNSSAKGFSKGVILHLYVLGISELFLNISGMEASIIIERESRTEIKGFGNFAFRMECDAVVLADFAAFKG